MSPGSRVSGWLLPAGLILALGLALLLPGPGIAAGHLSLGPLNWAGASVVVIFLISGYVLRLSPTTGIGLPRAAILVVVVGLLLPALLAWMLLRVIALPPGLAMGIAVMAVVPTTLSTATVITVVAGGDRNWAVALTLVSVLTGTFTAPLALSAVLAADVSVPPLPLLVTVVRVVVIPLGIGFLAARLIGRPAPTWVSVVPPLAVISVVWVTLSQSHEELVASSPSRLAVMVAVSIVGHTILLGAGWVAARGFAAGQGRAVLFVVAQKTLPLALSLIVAGTAVAPGLAALAPAAVLLAVIWHFIQLMIDSLIAGRMRSPRDDAGSSDPHGPDDPGRDRLVA